jgi:hypothetical protein
MLNFAAVVEHHIISYTLRNIYILVTLNRPTVLYAPHLPVHWLHLPRLNKPCQSWSCDSDGSHRSRAWMTRSRWSRWNHNQATFIDCPLQWKGGLKAASVDGFSPKHTHIQITHATAKKRRHGFPLPWKRPKSDILQISDAKRKLHNLKLLVLLKWKKSYKPELQDLPCLLAHSLWTMPPYPTALIR